MALFSSSLDCGKNTWNVVMLIVGADEHTVCEIDPGDPWNMNFLVAFEWTQADPQRLWLNDDACMNIVSIIVTRDTSHLEISPLKLEKANM